MCQDVYLPFLPSWSFLFCCLRIEKSLCENVSNIGVVEHNVSADLQFSHRCFERKSLDLFFNELTLVILFLSPFSLNPDRFTR